MGPNGTERRDEESRQGVSNQPHRPRQYAPFLPPTRQSHSRGISDSRLIKQRGCAGDRGRPLLVAASAAVRGRGAPVAELGVGAASRIRAVRGHNGWGVP